MSQQENHDASLMYTVVTLAPHYEQDKTIYYGIIAYNYYNYDFHYNFHLMLWCFILKSNEFCHMNINKPGFLDTARSAMNFGL